MRCGRSRVGESVTPTRLVAAILDAAIDGGTGMVMTLGQATQVSKLTKFAADSTAAFEAATGGNAAANRTGKGAFASINVGGTVREVYSTADLPRGWYRRRENNGWRPVRCAPPYRAT